MNEKEELAYVQGGRAVWLRLLRDALLHLRGDDSEVAKKELEIENSVLLTEREEAIAALRRVCGEHGDNDWEPDLHLADIINKHLGKHLDK